LSHPVRRVGMRDHLLMVGNHHMPLGKRHWRSDAAAFAITDFRGTPMLWVEGNYVIGEMSLTVAKPQLEHGSGVPAVPNDNETLLWFEAVSVGGLPMIRTWWAIGENIDRTMRRARLELFDRKTWPERMRQLLQMMKWVN
jgi:hypothetical protein